MTRSIHRPLIRAATILLLADCGLAADENLKTPYIMLDPASMPPPAAMGARLTQEPVNPNTTARFPADLGIPRIISRPEEGGETITLSNSAIALRVSIRGGRARIEGLRNCLAGEDLLSGSSEVFTVSSNGQRSSDAFRVARWDAYQYPGYAELRVAFWDDASGDGSGVTWRARLYRARPQLEQDFEARGGDAVFGQVLRTRPSLLPVMPANLFGRGFSNGRPNIPDRRRFEIAAESDHLCYDQKTSTGMWGFVAEIGGQERIAEGLFALIQNPSFRTKRGGRLGPFVIQPFQGPVELGFLDLRRYIEQRYAVQADTPSLYEWNQFWLWQGGPARVEYGAVTEKRLMDVLPRQVAMGLEEFHLDAGWERAPGDWRLDTSRFPGGWEAIRRFNRANGLAFHLWMNDPATDSPDVLLDLIEKSGIYRLFMDRRVTEKTAEAVEKVRAAYPGFSTSCHNSASRSAYYPWGNIHFLGDYNQVYFGEGQFWAWSNILPEANVEPVSDPLFPQRTEAERFFSRHDLHAGDLITRAAAYQAEWAWPFSCISPPHSGWSWFEKRPVADLRNRILTYLAARVNYQWGFDPAMLPPEALDLHLDCTAWFKANRQYLTVYQHVLDAPDGLGVDGAGHLISGRGFVFLFNPSSREQAVELKSILWEPELELRGNSVRLSDWTAMTSFRPLGARSLAMPTGRLSIPPRGALLLGINTDDAAILARVRAERARIGRPGG